MLVTDQLEWRQDWRWRRRIGRQGKERPSGTRRSGGRPGWKVKDSSWRDPPCGCVSTPTCSWKCAVKTRGCCNCSRCSRLRSRGASTCAGWTVTWNRRKKRRRRSVPELSLVPEHPHSTHPPFQSVHQSTTTTINAFIICKWGLLLLLLFVCLFVYKSSKSPVCRGWILQRDSDGGCGIWLWIVATAAMRRIRPRRIHLVPPPLYWLEHLSAIKQDRLHLSYSSRIYPTDQEGKIIQDRSGSPRMAKDHSGRLRIFQDHSGSLGII